MTPLEQYYQAGARLAYAVDEAWTEDGVPAERIREYVYAYREACSAVARDVAAADVRRHRLEREAATRWTGRR